MLIPQCIPCFLNESMIGKMSFPRALVVQGPLTCVRDDWHPNDSRRMYAECNEAASEVRSEIPNALTCYKQQIPNAVPSKSWLQRPTFAISLSKLLCSRVEHKKPTVSASTIHQLSIATDHPKQLPDSRQPVRSHPQFWRAQLAGPQSHCKQPLAVVSRSGHARLRSKA